MDRIKKRQSLSNTTTGFKPSKEKEQLLHKNWHHKMILQHHSAWPQVAKVDKTYQDALKPWIWSSCHILQTLRLWTVTFFQFKMPDLAHQHLWLHEGVSTWINSWTVSKDDQIFTRSVHTLLRIWWKAVANIGQFEWYMYCIASAPKPKSTWEDSVSEACAFQ